MLPRRILSLWFPRLGAEHVLRVRRSLPAGPFAIVAQEGNLQSLWSLNGPAEAEGLRRGQPLRDAQAICPALATAFRNPRGEAQFLTTLRRWAGRFSPWVSEEPPEGLLIDLTGTAHLFGGEEGVLDAVGRDCAALGLTVQAGIADTPGAAWALARFAAHDGAAARSGDAIDQEARATRSRAARRHWTKGGALPVPHGQPQVRVRIAAPGQTRQAIAPLPVAALRLDGTTVADLARLGLRQTGDLMGMPRAGLARRFGTGLVRRLDQALGLEPEPLSPARPPDRFAVRLTLPDPIGLAEDILAGIDRLLPALADRLAARGRGARRLRLQIFRADHSTQEIEIGFARPVVAADAIRPLLMLKLDEIDPGFGIDALRIEAHVTEPVHPAQERDHLGPTDAAERTTQETQGVALADLIGRMAARVGFEAITRLHPADSHIPEKAALVVNAAWSQPAGPWPPPAVPRPVMILRPEAVAAPDHPFPPAQFRWRRRAFITALATGPERIAPEWWLDEPDWRSGQRDYWRVETETGERLWLFFAHGGTVSGGWFCTGDFG